MVKDNHFYQVDNINEIFNAFSCSFGDILVSQFSNLERDLATFSDRVEYVDAKNLYELRETLLDKSHAFKIPYKALQNLFDSLAGSDFESVCVK